MKTIVKLAILMATLLLLTGVAFAQGDCFYYEYSYATFDDPLNTDTDCTQLCFNYGEPFGMYTNFCTYGNLVLFFDSMNEQALLYSGDSGDVEAGYLKFHGDNQSVFNGIIYCDVIGVPFRYEVRGHKVEECVAGM